MEPDSRMLQFIIDMSINARRNEGSWRSMLLTQPPVQDFEFFCDNERTAKNPLRNLKVHRETGVRWSDVFDELGLAAIGSKLTSIRSDYGSGRNVKVHLGTEKWS